jgi:hypothetical protein
VPPGKRKPAENKVEKTAEKKAEKKAEKAASVGGWAVGGMRSSLDFDSPPVAENRSNSSSSSSSSSSSNGGSRDNVADNGGGDGKNLRFTLKKSRSSDIGGARRGEGEGSGRRQEGIQRLRALAIEYGIDIRIEPPSHEHIPPTPTSHNEHKRAAAGTSHFRFSSLLLSFFRFTHVHSVRLRLTDGLNINT